MELPEPPLRVVILRVSCSGRRRVLPLGTSLHLTLLLTGCTDAGNFDTVQFLHQAPDIAANVSQNYAARWNGAERNGSGLSDTNNSYQQMERRSFAC
jgi:hypothetical protein